MKPELRFLGYDPRRAKRRLISRFLAPLGMLDWARLPKLRLAGYPETQARAEAACVSAGWHPKNSLLAALQRRVFAMAYNGSRAWFARNPEVIAVTWNGLKGLRRAFMDGARDSGGRTLYFELSPFKARLTCDPGGVNQANSLPRDKQFYLDWLVRSAIDPMAWRDHRSEISQRAALPARSSAEPTKDQAEDLAGPYVFAPLQVPGDSQLVVFGGEFRTVPAFVDALVAAADALPQGWHLRLKEHPSAAISHAHLIQGRSSRIVLDNQSDTFALVAKAEAVVTVNSSVGLEAMFFDRPVLACGQSFWALPGVAETARTAKDLAAYFAAPSAIRFDPKARAAFLTYLLHDYYIRTDTDPTAESARIALRLDPAKWPMPFPASTV